MGLNDYGIAVGNAADFIVWNAQTPDEVIATIAPPLLGYKRGRRVFTREMPVLHSPAQSCTVLH